MRSLRLALLAALLVPALACSSVDSPSAATVNGSEISIDVVDDELATIKGNEAYQQSLEQQFGATLEGVSEGSFDATFVARLLTFDIYYELVYQAIERRDLEVTKDDLDRARANIQSRLQDPSLFKEFDKKYQDILVRREASIDVLATDLAGGGVTDEEIEEYYEENRERFEERCVSHILVSTEGTTPEAARAEAEALRAQLVAGADFAALAQQSSDDPGSAQNGGSLDCITQDVNFVPEFKDAAFALAEGELSEPVESQFGFHLILVTEINLLPLDEVREQIESELQGPAQNALIDWLAARTASSDIEVNPRYGTWEAGGEGEAGQVAPPEQPTTTSTVGSQPFSAEP